MHSDELDRIRRAYALRQVADDAKLTFFGFQGMQHFFRVQERYRETLRALWGAGIRSLRGLRILDVGCGDGSMLRELLQWGADPKDLAGIELRADVASKARQLNPALDVRCGSASRLPWRDADFDLVCQHTVFTSILDIGLRYEVAREMMRVLRPGGMILWYDFMYNNPRNRDVRGIGAAEIKELFEGCDIHLKRITLAPPIARRIPSSLLPLLYPALASIPFLRTHYLGLFRKVGELST